MKGRERGGSETDRVVAVVDTEGAKLGVLLRDRVDRGRVVEEVTREITGEGDERDAGVRGHRRDDLDELGEPGTWGWRCADDDGRPGLYDEPLDREGEALGVAGRQRAGARDLPGVEGRVLDAIGPRNEREDAWISAGWFSFEHKHEATSQRAPSRRERADG